MNLKNVDLLVEHPYHVTSFQIVTTKYGNTPRVVLNDSIMAFIPKYYKT